MCVCKQQRLGIETCNNRPAVWLAATAVAVLLLLPPPLVRRRFRVRFVCSQTRSLYAFLCVAAPKGEPCNPRRPPLDRFNCCCRPAGRPPSVPIPLPIVCAAFSGSARPTGSALSEGSSGRAHPTRPVGDVRVRGGQTHTRERESASVPDGPQKRRHK